MRKIGERLQLAIRIKVNRIFDTDTVAATVWVIQPRLDGKDVAPLKCLVAAVQAQERRFVDVQAQAMSQAVNVALNRARLRSQRGMFLRLEVIAHYLLIKRSFFAYLASVAHLLKSPHHIIIGSLDLCRGITDAP